MTVPRKLGLAQIRKRSFKFDISCKPCPSRSHQRIEDVIAYTGGGPSADQLALALLLAGAAHRCKIRIAAGQFHLWPYLDGSSVSSVTSCHVFFVGTVVIEQIKLNQLDSLIFQIQQSSGNAPELRSVFRQVPLWYRAAIAGTPVTRPIDPRSRPKFHRFFSAAAHCRGRRYFAQES